MEIYLECPEGYNNKNCKYWKLKKALSVTWLNEKSFILELI